MGERGREKGGMQRAKASHPPLVSVISRGRAGYQGKSCCVVRSADSFVSSAPYCRGSVDGRFQRGGIRVCGCLHLVWGNKSARASHFAVLKCINLWSKRAIFTAPWLRLTKIYHPQGLLGCWSIAMSQWLQRQGFRVLFFKFDEKKVALKYISKVVVKPKKSIWYYSDSIVHILKRCLGSYASLLWIVTPCFFLSSAHLFLTLS